MRAHEILNEDLGTLSVLGKLADIAKQDIVSSRKLGSEIRPIDKKFSSNVVWMGLGSNSPIIEAGVLTTDFSDIRNAYRKASKQITGIGFSIFINNEPVCFGLLEQQDLRKSTHPFRIAYDISQYADIVEQYDSEKNSTKSQYNKTKTNLTTTYTKEPDRWDSTKTPKEYRGVIVTAGELDKILEPIIFIANTLNTQAIIKIIGNDAAGRDLRTKRYRLKDTPQLKLLQDRLKLYKNSKQPTASTIHDFIKMVSDNAADKIKFEGTTYSKKASSYNKVDPVELLSGKTFEISYSSADPGVYDSLYITYKYIPSTNTLAPIEARWLNPETRKYVREILDVKLWITKINGSENPEQNKPMILKNILELVKNNPKNPEILKIINTLVKLGYNWSEFNIIKKSLGIN